ncbi:MAG: pentapeptide repeat-containing protein [Burkholderiales bacterium]|nr:pentapeptide repeat-containing protein [Burkholderiales bacterium]
MKFKQINLAIFGVLLVALSGCVGDNMNSTGSSNSVTGVQQTPQNTSSDEQLGAYYPIPEGTYKNVCNEIEVLPGGILHAKCGAKTDIHIDESFLYLGSCKAGSTVSSSLVEKTDGYNHKDYSNYKLNCDIADTEGFLSGQVCYGSSKKAKNQGCYRFGYEGEWDRIDSDMRGSIYFGSFDNQIRMKAHFESSNFSSAVLSSVKLNAWLQHTQFKNAYLYDVINDAKIWSDGMEADYADFSGATLKSCNFKGNGSNRVKFKYTKFDRATLIDGSIFRYLDFSNASFKSASLNDVNFVNTNLSNVDFNGSHIEKADFSGEDSNGGHTILNKTSFVNNKIINSKFNNANTNAALDARYVDFSGSSISNTSFNNSKLNANFNDSIIIGSSSFANTDFSGPVSRSSSFVNTYVQFSSFVAANFNGANLTNALFESSNLSGAKFQGANFNGVQFVDSNLRGADFSQVKNLNANSFPGSDLTGATGIKLTPCAESSIGQCK